MLYKGDLVSTRDSIYGRTLRGPVVTKAAGNATLAASDLGKYVIVQSNAGGQTVTLPEGTIPGAFIDVYNIGTHTMDIVLDGADTAFPPGTSRIAPGQRAKCKVNTANNWYLPGKGGEGRGLQEHFYYHRVLEYQDTSQQTFGTSAGDPPTVPPVGSKLDFALGSKVIDTGFLDNAASDNLLFTRAIQARITCHATVEVPGGDQLYGYIVKNGTTALDIASVSVRNAEYSQITLRAEPLLAATNTIDFRFTSNTNAAELRGFSVTVEEILPEAEKSGPVFDPAIFIYTRTTNVGSAPANDVAIDMDSLASSYGSGVTRNAGGTYTLDPGTWLLRGGFHPNFTGYVDPNPLLRYSWRDVTSAGDPVNDAGVTIGEQTRNNNSVSYDSLFQPNAFGIVVVPPGETKTVKLAIDSQVRLADVLYFSAFVFERLVP